jgi:transposase
MARPATVFAKIPNQEQRDRLVELWKQHPNHYTRMRAHAIILSDAQYQVDQIVDIFGVSRDSVRAWIKRFAEGGPDALLDEDKPGGPRNSTSRKKRS